MGEEPLIFNEIVIAEWPKGRDRVVRVRLLRDLLSGPHRGVAVVEIRTGMYWGAQWMAKHETSDTHPS